MELTLWTCPLCHSPLRLEDRQYRCADGHAFDRAKEGYVNLLASNRKRSVAPGDDRHMMRSRREFLKSGHYLPLAELLARLCSEQTARTTDPAFTLLDIGCGEGYYTGYIAEALRNVIPERNLWVGGIDISKEAARMASKRHRQVQFAVASNVALPLLEGRADCALRIFAPGADAEIVRVLKPGGLFVSVVPGERHLFGLRELVYDHPREHLVALKHIDGLRHVGRQCLDYRIRIEGKGHVANLLSMTPYYWQANREKQIKIAGLTAAEVEVSFRIDSYRCPRGS